MSTDTLWYKDAVIYQLHVKAFFDSDNSGVGDLAGLTSKLDYIESLGVTAIWLLPFYPSPLRDDGYDISGFTSVNPSYGTMRDFRRLVREAHRRGLRVITELVINHTSDQHPWFQRARRARPGSRWRNYYVWSDTDQKYAGTRIIFTDTEKSNWTWDPEAEAYYWHRFFSHQPDLNFDNPEVVDQVIRVMRHWLDAGVDGLRLDAIPYLCEREGTHNENLPETHQVLKELRRALDERYEDKMLLAEANQWPEDVVPYFGDGDECHMAFNFPLMPRLYMAVAQEDRHPITDIIHQMPSIPETCQWAIFLRNHDELTLEMVTDRERDYLWNFYAADRRMRINLGIRRRMAPLVDNDPQKIKLLNSLLMSMPGTPVLYYGDEIGMGDNIYLGDRDAVRTPMQWSPDRNAGFSKADPARLYLPAIMDPVYGYDAVNVEAQDRNASSLLNWMRKLIGIHKGHACFARGSIRFLTPGNRKVLAYILEDEQERILCVVNLSRAPQPVELRLPEFDGWVPIELFGQSRFPPIGQLPYFITLAGYGFYWFLLTTEADAPHWHGPVSPSLPEFVTLVAPRGWSSLLTGPPRQTLEQEILPAYIGNRRWFGEKDSALTTIELALAAHPRSEPGGWMLTTWRTRTAEGIESTYFLPLAIAWEEDTEDPLAARTGFALGRVRTGPRMGGLYDALAEPDFVRELVALMRERHEITGIGDGDVLRFSGTQALDAFPETTSDVPVERLGREQSNTSLLIGDRMILKAYRKLQAGVHPEIEVGRFLTERAGYENAPAYCGSLEHVDAAGTPVALVVVHELVPNQGDGWGFTIDYLDRFLEDAEGWIGDFSDEEVPYLDYCQLAQTLGNRTAELHRAFTIDTDDPAFRPEKIDARDLAAWGQGLARQAAAAREALEKTGENASADVGERIGAVLGSWDAVESLARSLIPQGVEALKSRYHGDYHLGQVMVAASDFYIIDFEGEPARPLAERRLKHSPLRDVAGMLRSFSYAASTGLFRVAARARPDVVEAVRPWVRRWEQATKRAFLDGYRAAIGDCPSYPAEADTEQRLIDLFVLEKALYEVKYEAANRPSWLKIPLQGILELLARREEGAQTR